MPNLSIKNVPEDVVEKLRQRAARHHRSLQGELMDLICRVANGPTDGPTDETTDEEFPETRISNVASESSGWLSIDELAAELRTSKVRPPENVPLAVDIIRQERDAR